jgi:hypothetical protein
MRSYFKSLGRAAEAKKSRNKCNRCHIKCGKKPKGLKWKAELTCTDANGDEQSWFVDEPIDPCVPYGVGCGVCYEFAKTGVLGLLDFKLLHAICRHARMSSHIYRCVHV